MMCAGELFFCLEDSSTTPQDIILVDQIKIKING
jgi:hypothetical protein